MVWEERQEQTREALLRGRSLLSLPPAQVLGLRSRIPVGASPDLALPALLVTFSHSGLQQKKSLATAYSPTPHGAVPSALEGLTSVFGMGTGVAPPLESPGNDSIVWQRKGDQEDTVKSHGGLVLVG